MAKTIEEVLEALKSKVSIVDSEAITHKCSKCKDAGGWVEIREADVFGDGRVVRDEEVWVECSCAIQRKVERIVQASAITPEFQKMGFKNFHTDTARSASINEQRKAMRKIAVDYYNTFPDIKDSRENSIAFMGQVGAGKTHLLSAVANGLMRERRVQVMYFPFVEMLEAMSADNYGAKDEIVTKAQQAEVLFLDDLFKPTSSEVRGQIVTAPRATPFMQTVIQAIVNYRYLNNKPILLSCELDFVTLLDINEALGSRLFEMCSDYVMQIDSDAHLNYRMRKLTGEG